ncbi:MULTISPECIES: DUF6940 family protein [unclassified Aureispira]|uniref:DUF6940 family protein n=1 Tax=unclassified Aureispira TaxID=2649989 RepID=UPI000695C5C5|nr:MULTISPECIES: hypothetical protein [unclassified Aureispira]WMX12135.1 hypothetical protein QP953_15005 [Aureispira sp. CCB-E]
MFQYIEKVLAKNTFQFQITQDDVLMTFEQVLELWECSRTFRLFYTQILREVPFAAFFWEHKGIHKTNLQQTYEFVIVGTNAFDGKQANSTPFNTYFSSKEESVVCFSNLGNNARLVVPCPNSSKEVYTHLGTFIRNAPYQQIDTFWQTVSKELQQNINQQPLWLSTSGLGVYWLHARLDQRPKYYTHAPYRKV